MKTLYAFALAAILSVALAVPVAAADPIRPFRGDSAPSFGTYLDPGATSDWYGACPAGTSWRHVDLGWGQFTHLGRTYI